MYRDTNTISVVLEPIRVRQSIVPNQYLPVVKTGGNAVTERLRVVKLGIG